MDSEPAVKTVMTTALRNRNIATAALLIGFVGGAYVWTTSKMSTNELSEAVSELDEVRALKAQHAAPPAAGSGAKPSGPR